MDDFESLMEQAGIAEKQTAPVESRNKPTKQPFSLERFSLTGQSEVMKKSILETRYVLNDLAILGQATAIYAKPNSGKTLITLRLVADSIAAGGIDGNKVFYINADDDYNGLVIKLEIAEKYRFNMCCPGLGGFQSKGLLAYIRALIKDNQASGTIIILDTLKKFVSLMDKTDTSAFMAIGREFITRGGTLILLAHVNKNRDTEGRVVFAGVSDIIDDVDCAYTLDVTCREKNISTAIFENLKMRGNVKKEVGYTFSTADSLSYVDKFYSIKLVDSGSLKSAKDAKAIMDLLDENALVIEEIIEAINIGISKKRSLLMQFTRIVAMPNL